METNSSTNEILILLIDTHDDVVIGLRNKQPYSQQQLDDFLVLARYNQNHREIISSLVIRLRVKSPKIRRSLGEQFNDVFGLLQTSTNGLLEIAGVPKNANEINSLPVGKLKRDICIQLEVIP